VTIIGHNKTDMNAMLSKHQQFFERLLLTERLEVLTGVFSRLAFLGM